MAEGALNSVAASNRAQKGLLRHNAAEPLIDLGRLDEALAHIDEGLNLALPDVQDQGLLRLRAYVHMLRGNTEAAEADLRQVARRGRFSPEDIELQHLIPTATQQIMLAAQRGVGEQVGTELRRVFNSGVREEVEWWAWPLLHAAASALTDLGSQDDELRALIRRHAAAIPQRVPIHDLYARLITAELACPADAATVSAPSSAPTSVWAELAGLADAMGAPVMLRAQIRLREAQHAAATPGGREAAAAAAREARRLAVSLGAEPLLARVDALARSARLLSVVPSDEPGTAPPAPAVPGLTVRETDVLRLVAEGLSNGQIGARLYITTKTVSVHVSNILAKLGVSSRTEAAAVAHRDRLLEPAA